jgi:CRP/FNR family transcriptional regulator, cyclic AMP receptor protein
MRQVKALLLRRGKLGEEISPADRADVGMSGGAVQVTRAELDGLALFSGLSDATLEFLRLRLRCVSYKASCSVFVEGDPGPTLYALLSGEVELIKKSAHGKEVSLARLGPGRWFGEGGLIDMEPREASARALSDVELLRLTSADLDALYRHDPKGYSLLVLNVARGLSRRLRSVHGLLADALDKA